MLFSPKGPALLAAVIFLAGLGVLSGCAISNTSGSSAELNPTPLLTSGITGRVQGGQQPLSGSTIQLYAVGTTATGSAATPLLPPGVTTNSSGSFSLTGRFACTNATLVYLTATGGNPGTAFNNSNIVEMAALGPCSSLSAGTFISVNELTTVAAASALQSFMTGIATVGSSSADANLLAAAFTLANQYVDSATGRTPGRNVPAGMTPPAFELNTLGNIVASCVNSAGGTAGDSSPCGTLFAATSLPGSVPADTLSALLNLSVNPALNTSTLFGLASPTGPFQPVLTERTPNFRVRLKPAGENDSPMLYGYSAFGDSNTRGAPTTPAVLSYPDMLQSLYAPSTAPYLRLSRPGDACWGMNNIMFTYLNVQNSANPAITDMIGSNDGGLVLSAGGTQYYTGCQFAANARAAMGPQATIPASSPYLAASGTWTADASYTNFPGLQSSTNGSCLRAYGSIPNGVLYVWYAVEQNYASALGGQFQVMLDGVVQTDTVSGAQSIATNAPLFVPGLQSYVSLARFQTSPGNHDVAACVTSPTGALNDVHLYAFGLPGKAACAGPGCPRVFLGGVIHFQDDPADQAVPGLAIANNVNAQVASTLAADGLAVTFVDVRKYVDAHLGMLSTPEKGCGVSGVPGQHVNDCGTLDLAQAFAAAMNLPE